MLVTRECKSFIVRAYCDSCSGVELKRTGATVTSCSPILHEHECPSCDHSIYFTDKYPFTKHVEVTPDDYLAGNLL